MSFQPSDRTFRPVALALNLLALAVLPAVAQEAADSECGDPERHRTVIKATMHIEVSEAESVLGLLGVNYALKPDQNLIVLRGEGYAVDTALKVIDALDVPRPTIDLVVYVLSASKQGTAEVPESLKTAVGQLQTVFGYSGFKLLDHVTLRVLEGRSGRADGGILLGDDTRRTGYHFAFKKVSVVPEDDVVRIRLKGLTFAVNGAGSETHRARLMTDVEIRAGQKAVIGSSTPQGIGDTLVLIVEASAPRDRSSQAD